MKLKYMYDKIQSALIKLIIWAFNVTIYMKLCLASDIIYKSIECSEKSGLIMEKSLDFLIFSLLVLVGIRQTAL